VTKLIKQEPNAEKAIQLYQQLKQHNLSPNVFVINSLIKVLRNSNREKDSLLLVEDVLNHNILDKYILNFLLQCSVEFNHKDTEALLSQVIKYKKVLQIDKTKFIDRLDTFSETVGGQRQVGQGILLVR
jgi:GTP-sensing pleiotropic transcriptional regulator CodY